MSDIFSILGFICLLICFIYFLFFGMYLMLFTVASFFYRNLHSQPKEPDQHRFAIYIPAYKEDSVIVSTAMAATKQNYPQHLFDVFIIADHLRPQTIDALKKLSVITVPVSFENSTKAKALHVALQNTTEHYDYAVVLDADNIMEPDFLSKINTRIGSKPFKVLQTHRMAKNSNTDMAILDGLSEEINNTIFRKGHTVCGLSSALIGSGMVFDFSLYRSIIPTVVAVGGFDKELELRLLKDRVRIAYANDIAVFDEKVQDIATFKKQRTRWFSAQLVYLSRYWFSGIYHLLTKGNVDFFDKVIQMLAPPRVVQLFLLPVFLAATLIAGRLLNIPLVPWHWWALVTAITYVAVILAIPRRMYQTISITMIFHLPKALFAMLMAMSKTKGANKQFIHTKHGTEI